MRLLVLGDSLSEGVGDPAPGRAGLRGELRGWPHHLRDLAAALEADVEVTNLARAGAGVPEVAGGQLPRALTTPADAVVCLVGVNDVLRRGFSAQAFATSYDGLLASLATHLAATEGPTALVGARLHDVAAHLPLGAAGRARARRNVEVANLAVERAAARHGAVLLGGDFVDHVVADGGLLSLDRLHPNAPGHRRVAVEVLRALQAACVLPAGDVDVPEVVDGARWKSSAAHAVWLVRRGPGQLLRGRVPALRARHHR